MELQRRSQRPKQKHYYCHVLMDYKYLSIDARRKGNLARFINHSCEPNCEIMEWMVEGVPRVGFFALRDISVGEEITMSSYGLMSTPNLKRRPCKCKSLSCTGYMDLTPEEANARVSDILLFSY